MPAVSKAQRRFMAWKEHTPGGPKSMGMSKDQLHDFAATSEQDLPEHADSGAPPMKARFARWVGHHNGPAQSIFPGGHETDGVQHKFAKTTDYMDEGTPNVKLSNREFVSEHERLPSILRSGSDSERKEEAREQEGELRSRFPTDYSDSGNTGNWMQRAVKRPGALTKKANAAGETPMTFARKNYHAKGRTGEQARFAVNAQK